MPTTNAKSLTPLFKGGHRNLNEIGICAVRKKMLQFHTLTIRKVVRIVGLSFFPTVVSSTSAKSLTPSFRGIL